MSRINSAISLEFLTDEHLLAEHREIKRLPYCLSRAIISGSINKVPDYFTLGPGHILFFLNKMQFTHFRYLSLHEECLRRGFSVLNYSENWEPWIGTEYYRMYVPEEREFILLRDRIVERIMGSSKEFWHYKSERISKDDACNLLWARV